MPRATIELQGVEEIIRTTAGEGFRADKTNIIREVGAATSSRVLAVIDIPE